LLAGMDHRLVMSEDARKDREKNKKEGQTKSMVTAAALSLAFSEQEGSELDAIRQAQNDRLHDRIFAACYAEPDLVNTVIDVLYGKDTDYYSSQVISTSDERGTFDFSLQHLNNCGLSPNDSMTLSKVNCGIVVALTVASVTTTQEMFDVLWEIRRYGLQKRVEGDHEVNPLLEGLADLTLEKEKPGKKYDILEQFAPQSAGNPLAQELTKKIAHELRWCTKGVSSDKRLNTLRALLAMTWDTVPTGSASGVLSKLENPKAAVEIHEMRAWQLQRYIRKTQKHLRRGEVGAIMHKMLDLVTSAIALAEILAKEPTPLLY